MIYIDKAILPYRGQLWCHLAADTIAELCSTAIKLGLRREWFQHPPEASWPHYDLAPARRVHALKLGALEIGRHELLYRSSVLTLEWTKVYGSPVEIEDCERRYYRHLKGFLDTAFATKTV